MIEILLDPNVNVNAVTEMDLLRFVATSASDTRVAVVRFETKCIRAIFASSLSLLSYL